MPLYVLEVNRIGAVKAGDDHHWCSDQGQGNKNKTFAPYKEATFDIIYGKGVSRGSSIIDKAVEVGVIKKSGAWYTDTEGESLGQGKPAVIDLLDTDDVLYARILSTVEGKVMGTQAGELNGLGGQGILEVGGETSNHADNGMYAMFAPKSKDGAQGVAICKTIGAEDWDVALLGYERKTHPGQPGIQGNARSRRAR